MRRSIFPVWSRNCLSSCDRRLNCSVWLRHWSSRSFTRACQERHSMRHKPITKPLMRLQTAFAFAASFQWVSDSKNLNVCPAQEGSIGTGSSAPTVSLKTWDSSSMRRLTASSIRNYPWNTGFELQYPIQALHKTRWDKSKINKPWKEKDWKDFACLLQH